MTAYKPSPGSYVMSARDHMTETIIYMRSAVAELPAGADRVEAEAVLRGLVETVAPRLSRLRAGLS